MKKYFAIIITSIILSLSLLMPSLAADKKVIRLSEDYKELYFSDYTYTRVDASMLRFNQSASEVVDTYDKAVDDVYIYDAETVSADYNSIYKFKLTEAQHKEIKSVGIINTNHDETLFFVQIVFFDGSVLYIDFIREDLVDEYLKVINGETKEYYVDFRWPDDNIITADRDKFYIGKEKLVSFWDCTLDVTVYADSTTGSFDSEVGTILKFDEKYYFYSFVNSSIKSTDELWEYDDLKIEVIELSDEELVAQLKEGEQKYLDDDYGYLFDDELQETVARIFFVITFALIPLAIFALTLILGIKAKKGVYKKLLLITSGLSLASIGTFIYIAFVLFNK